MKRVLAVVCLLLVALFGVMAFRAWRVPSPTTAVVTASESIAVDTVAAAQRLAGAVKFPTVSLASGAPIDTAAFRGLHQRLATSFARVHATLTREVIGGLSLLYTWKGADSTLAPVVLMGHMDVVPMPETNLREWTHAPFSGDTADGYVGSRNVGRQDDRSRDPRSRRVAAWRRVHAHAHSDVADDAERGDQGQRAAA